MVMWQGVMAVAPLYVRHCIPVCEGQLWSVVHLTECLKLWAPPRESVINKTSIIFLLFPVVLITVACVHVSMGHCGPQWTKASCRRPGAFHAPDVVGVWRESLIVIVCLPNDSRHVASKVHVGAWARRGISVTAYVACLHVSVYMSSVISVGCIAGIVGVGGMLMVVVMWDAEVGSTWAARGTGWMNLFLGARWGFDERSGRAGGWLRQTGAQWTLQLCDVITVLEGRRKKEDTWVPIKSDA